MFMSDADVLAQRRRYEDLLLWADPRRLVPKVRRSRRREARARRALDPQARA